MQEFQTITLEKIKELTFSEAYNIVCINYDEKNGINIFTEDDTKDYLGKNVNSFLEIKQLNNKIEEMYRIYIFNKDFMITIFNFGNDEFGNTQYRYNEVLNSDFKNSYIKYIYSKDPKEPKNAQKYSKLKVRVGTLKNNEREAIQYIGYVEGGVKVNE